MNINELQTQLNNFQRELNSLKKLDEQKWEIPGGDLYLNANNIVSDGRSTNSTRLVGREFKTKEEALKAAIHHTNFGIFYHLALDLNDGWVANWSNINQKKWHLFYNHNLNLWERNFTTRYQKTAISFCDEASDKAIKILNDQELLTL
jgi:hypothetical protein